jgi:hypothetical protein
MWTETSLRTTSRHEQRHAVLPRELPYFSRTAVVSTWLTVCTKQQTLFSNSTYQWIDKRVDLLCVCEGPRSRCYGRTAALKLIVQPCDEDD